MAIDIVWFLDVKWIHMSLIAAGFAAGIHFIASIIAAARIRRSAAILFVVLVPIYTFISCLFYVIILAISVGYTYRFINADPQGVIVYWGLGFGALYIVIKVIVAGYLK